MQELAFVFGIHALFIFSTLIFIFLESYNQKIKSIEARYIMLPIKQHIIHTTFDAKHFKTSTEISVYDLELTSIRRIKKRLALQLLSDIEEYITFERFPPTNKPYERIEASLLIGIKQCNH